MGSAGTALFGDSGSGQLQQAAREKAAMAAQNYNVTKGITDQAVSAGSAQFEKDIANQERNLARQEQMIAQIDPTIVEASQQALRLLRGEQSSTLQPLQNQRAQQRQQLLNSLRSQMGPGAESSSAGMQILTKFDSESANIMAGAQQQALQQMGNTAGQFNAVRPDMFREILGRSSFGQGRSNLLFDQANALQASMGNMYDAAGGESAARAMNQQQNSAFGMQLFSSAVKAGSALASGGASEAGAASSNGPSMGQRFMAGIGADQRGRNR